MLSSSKQFSKQSPFSNAATGEPDSTLVYVTWPVDFNLEGVLITTKDTARTMQDQLDLGKDLIITPGIYELDQPLTVKFHDQVILCIGMATLVAPTNGQPCVKVLKGLTGVRLAGLFLEASVQVVPWGPRPIPGSTLLHWGVDEPLPANVTSGTPSQDNPSGYIYDLFCRVGGQNDNPDVGVDIIAQIDSDWVIGDNFWLWRADHSGKTPVNHPEVSKNFYQTVLGEYPCNTGLKVTGDNVYIYGLAVEHTVQDNVVWTGSGGRTYFFQNEFPYDVDQRYGHHKYAGYRVDGRHWKGKGTFTHRAYALGTYAYYRDHPVVTPAGIQISPAHKTKSTDVKVINGFSVFLNGQSPAGVGSVVGNIGDDGILTTIGEASLGKEQKKRVSEHKLYRQV